MIPGLEQDLEHIFAHTPGIWDVFRGERVFITGGTGFVGTWLVASFLYANERLGLRATLSLLTRDPDAFRRRAPWVADHSAVRFVTGEAGTFDFAHGQFPFVIHGATDQAPASRDEPTGTFDRELRATRRALEFASEHGTKRLLFTSSGAAYGKQPSDVTHIPEAYSGAPATTDLNTAYGQAKHASEFMCCLYGKEFGFDVILARLFAFSGAYLPLGANFAIGNFMRDVLLGGPVRIGGDGTPYRSYLYAADLAIWLWTLLAKGKGQRVYNVGSDEDLTIEDLARAVVRETDPRVEIEIAGKKIPGAAPARYVPAIDRAKEELGLRPLIPLSQQIRRMYAWNRQNNLVS